VSKIRFWELENFDLVNAFYDVDGLIFGLNVENIMWNIVSPT
jgi:hypothetical protein